MERPARFTRTALLVGALALAVVGGLAAKVYHGARAVEALAEFCEGSSERLRLACLKTSPADASPTPPEA